MRRRRYRLNPLSKKQSKTLLIGGAVAAGVVGAVALAMWAAKPAQAAGKLSTGLQSWQPVNDLTIRGGSTYRFSMDDPTNLANAAAVAQMVPYTSKFDTSMSNIVVYPAAPSDWPGNDTSDTTRVRMQFTAPAGLPVVQLPNVLGVKLWVLA